MCIRDRFNTQLMGKDLLYWSSTLLDLSRKGLENRDVLSKKGNNETVFLNHLQKVIDNKTTNADHMISKFSKNENLDEVHELISTWDIDKIINAYLEAPQKGFNTQLMGKDLLYWSSTLLNLSRKGLENRDVLSKKGNNETLFLNHLQKAVSYTH